MAALFTLMLGLATTQIVLRNFFDTGLIWGDDAIKVLVLWIAMTGALYATRNARHINIDVITRFLPGALANKVRRLLFLFASLICLLAAWHSYQFILLDMEDPIIAFLTIPTWLCELIIPVALLLMACRFAFMVLHLPTDETKPTTQTDTP